MRILLFLGVMYRFLKIWYNNYELYYRTMIDQERVNPSAVLTTGNELEVLQ